MKYLAGLEILLRQSQVFILILCSCARPLFPNMGRGQFPMGKFDCLKWGPTIIDHRDDEEN